MTTENLGIEKNMQKIYLTTVTMCGTIHLAQLIFYAFTGYSVYTIYNVCAVIYFIFLWLFTLRGNYRYVMSLLHVELMLYVCFSVYLMGLDTGDPYILLMASSFTYLNPYKKSMTTYMFSLAHLSVFVLIGIYGSYFSPFYTGVNETIFEVHYFFFILICFTITISMAHTAKVTSLAATAKFDDPYDIKIDKLTYLNTRRHFLQTYNDIDVGNYIVAIVDMDNIAKISLKYNFDLGNHILASVSNILLRYKNDYIELCRWDDDQFLILFTEYNYSYAHEVVDNILKDIRYMEFRYENDNFNVTATAGLEQSSDEDEFLDVIQRAELKMKSGKISGKNRVIK